MGPRSILQILLGLCLLGTMGGCGAFADAVDPDGGHIPDRSRLTYEADNYLVQGQTKVIKVRFVDPPPWSGVDGGLAFLTDLSFVDNTDEGKKLDDINLVEVDYDGLQSIELTLLASQQADTDTPRLMIIKVAFELTGQPQQIFTGAGRFWVIAPTDTQETDGGMDGGDQ